MAVIVPSSTRRAEAHYKGEVLGRLEELASLVCRGTPIARLQPVGRHA